MERTWIITDSASSFSTSDFLIAGPELGLGSKGYCRKFTLSGGSQNGVELIEVSNGVLTLRVCPTRGMGIIDGEFAGRRVGWKSPVREIVHPAFINLFDLGGRGAHYGFNELLNRCGTEWSGAMGEDVTVDNMGTRSTVFLPLHGRIGWTPASRVELRADGNGSIRLLGDIPERNVFGANYLLQTELTLREGNASIRVRDTLRNLGALPGEYEMLYHTNFGPPFLEAGSSYIGTYDLVVPRDRFAAEGMDEFRVFPGPTAGYTEQVYLFRAHPDSNGRAHQLLANTDRTLAARVSFATSTLPYAILWKRCAAIEDGYVAGLNPCSDLPNNRRVEREGGRVGRISPGSDVTFEIEIGLIEGKPEVARHISEIEAVRGRGETGRPGDFDSLTVPSI